MKNLLSIISKIHEKGNRFIIEQINTNGNEGLVTSHGDILACLYQGNKMTMKDIAERINKTKATVTVLVDKLEKNGYVKREKSTEDSRNTYISLTKKGEDFKPVFEKISKELNELLYKNLSKDEAQILDILLQKMI